MLPEMIEPALIWPTGRQSTFRSQGPLLYSALPARQADAANGLERAISKNILERTTVGGFVPFRAAPQLVGNFVVWRNPLPRLSESFAYSINPEAEFDVRIGQI